MEFLRALESLGQAWYRYGLRDDSRDVGFFSLTLPSLGNPEPEVISYQDLRGVLGGARAPSHLETTLDTLSPPRPISGLNLTISLSMSIKTT
ncbi:MAG: hypothetical protein R2865_04985 [Deinococcales bacterium]